jgi:hypothetical protein
MKSLKKTYKSKTRKFYNMKGCSLAKFKKGGKKCKMCWGNLKGGTCTCSSCMHGGRTRRYKKMLAYRQNAGGQINTELPYGAINNYGGERIHMKGGNNGKCPDGLVGSNWEGEVNKWPGVDGVSGNRNYLQYNNNEFNPLTQGVYNTRGLFGGKKTKLQKAGGLIPQDLVNMGRQTIFGLGSAYNALRGYEAPVNPMPYKQFNGTPNVDNLQYYRL